MIRMIHPLHIVTQILGRHLIPKGPGGESQRQIMRIIVARLPEQEVGSSRRRRKTAA
jgi:hypothetical protein